MIDPESIRHYACGPKAAPNGLEYVHLLGGPLDGGVGSIHPKGSTQFLSSWTPELGYAYHRYRDSGLICADCSRRIFEGPIP